MESGTPPPPVATPLPQGVGPSKEERNLSLLCHLLGLTGFMFPAANIIAPLVLWLIKKEGMPFLDDQGKEAINFQITVTIAAVVCLVTSFLLIPIIILIGIGIASLILVIIAAIKSSEGVPYRYPFTLRLIK